MSELEKFLVTFRPEVFETLQAACRTNKRSAYLAGLVVEHDRRWRQAMGHLRAHGWEVADIRTATKALSKIPFSTQDAVAQELDCVGYKHFAECARKSCDTSIALGMLADEWRLGNEELRHRLGDV